MVALGAGMLAAVNPCGFALLPAYLSLLIVGNQPSGRVRGVGRALGLTLAMTAGFATVFVVFGLAVAPAASGIQEHLPWFTVVLGIVLMAVGGWLLAGRSLTLPRLAGRRSARPLTGSPLSMAGFGVAYALASLTCTIAPFLAVVVTGFRADSVLVGVALFATYAAGMGLVVGTMAVATALASDTLIRRVRRSSRWVPRLSGALLAAAGAYVAYYGAWELRVLSGKDSSDPVVGGAGAVQRWLAGVVEATGPGGWLILGAVLVGLAVLSTRLRRS